MYVHPKDFSSHAGVECKACSEKADLIQRVKETIHLPVKGAAKDGDSRAEARAESSGGGRASSSASAGSSHASATSDSGDDAPEDIKEILENLKRSQNPAASDDDTPQNIKDILAKLKKSGGDYKVRLRLHEWAAQQKMLRLHNLQARTLQDGSQSELAGHAVSTKV